jgi:raffinose synthase
VAEGECVFEILRRAVHTVSRRLKSFLPRDAKPSPAFLDHFGWCTWNAFYDTVTADKIANGLETWKRRDLVPGLLIVDDGWLDRCGDYLNAFPASPSVFPGGLAEFSKFVRRAFGVKMFGVWHAFQGYWGGINPQGPLGGRFRTVPNRGKIRPWEENNGKESDLFLVHPEEATGFYAEFYRYLRASGVDFVKVDGQSATEVFSQGVLGRVDVMKAYQQAFQSAGLREFGSEVLHCMAHGNDVIWHCRSSNAMRSSDDYRPLHDDSWQEQHIVDNAYNSLLIGQVAFADWDMFQSHRPHSAYHAASRALSGGPIYVSDEPGKQDISLLEKLVRFDGLTARTLRCPQPASVTRDCLLRDCQREHRLLKIFNHVNGVGLLGLFHVSSEAGPVVDFFRPGDVEALEGARFAVWRHQAQTLEIADRFETISQRLEAMQWEIAVVSPISGGVALLGNVDKFNAPAAISDYTQNAGEIRFDALDGGSIALYSSRCPGAVEVNDRRVKFFHDAPSGLLTFCTPARQVSSVVVSWS